MTLNNNVLKSTQLSIKRLNGLGFYALVILFWIAQLFAPVDTVVTFGEKTSLQEFFNKGFLLSKMLTPFEIIVILLSLFLLLNFKNYYVGNKFFKKFFILNLIIIIISLLNPNNSYSLLFYIVGRSIRSFYFFLLFLYVITFLRKDIYNRFIIKMFTIGSVIAILLALYSFVFFLIGKGMIYQGRNVTITQGDTLEWIVIFQILFFAIYLQYNRKKYLLISLLFFIILLFSYRRTGLLECLLVDFLILGFHFIKSKGLSAKFKKILSYGLVAIVILLSLDYFLSENVIYDYTQRYLGAFSFFIPQNVQNIVYTDSGHMQQAITTTQSFFNNIGRFWGSGYKSGGAFYVEGQSVAIHNSFVNAWATFGLYMTIYLLILTIIFISKSLNIFFSKRKKNESYSYITIVFIFYLALFFVAGWSNGQSFLGHLQYLTKFVLLVSLLKLDKKIIDKYLHL